MVAGTSSAMCGRTWALKAVRFAFGTGLAEQQSGSESRQQQQPAVEAVAGTAAGAVAAVGAAGVAGSVVEEAASRDRYHEQCC
jgi:hypothetical protein